jgi:hypothetical protein
MVLDATQSISFWHQIINKHHSQFGNTPASYLGRSGVQSKAKN